MVAIAVAAIFVAVMVAVVLSVSRAAFVPPPLHVALMGTGHSEDRCSDEQQSGTHGCPFEQRLQAAR